MQSFHNKRLVKNRVSDNTKSNQWQHRINKWSETITVHPYLAVVKSLPCLQYLCEKGCDPTGRTILGATLIHFAAHYGQIEIVDYLIKKYYFDPNTPGWTNRAPVHCATECGHLDLLKHLINKYDCWATITDDTPLHFAAAQDHLPIVKHLWTVTLCRQVTMATLPFMMLLEMATWRWSSSWSRLFTALLIRGDHVTWPHWNGLSLKDTFML